ncbi:MAG: histidine--tRNA ligase [Myxococcales bacterium]|nr:histidine--tRNA ligase [Myxococcales bacterium]
MVVRAVRGMKDILPDEAARWQRLEHTFRSIVERAGYGEVRTPHLESTELFVREIGADTDVVAKEMYSFSRHDDELTVRPEGTAGAARAYVQNNLAQLEPVTRWYYLGPMFRAERPAKGRFRQFHQAGCEIYGDAGPACDAELIAMCTELVMALGVRDFVVHVNSIGSAGTRARYRDALRDYFSPLAGSLSDDSQRRLVTNPLRILDSKDPRDQEASRGAPSVSALLDEDDAAHLAKLRGYLEDLGVPYVFDPRLVRGLDYYTRTLFELKITSGELGAQDALLGGGRYDEMIQHLGNKKPVPAIGFAMGLERILAVTPLGAPRAGPDCFFAPLVESAVGRSLVLAKSLREHGVSCELDGRGQSVKAMLRRANAMKARLVAIVGQEELERGEVTVKDLDRHEQVRVPFADLFDAVRARLAVPRSSSELSRDELRVPASVP